jgi:protein-arginine deiminase
VSYPMGRLFRGSIPTFAPDPAFSKMLESQAVQPQLYVDTSWLLVGHVDETVSFLKANNARGWVMMVNDARLAKTMLEAEVTKGNGAVTMFKGKFWYDQFGNPFAAEKSITAVLADTDVMAESAKAAAEIDAQIAILKAETGITDAEIIRVPFLHHKDFGYSVAYQPGTVNSHVLDDKNLVTPDPFGPVIGGKDIFKDHLETALAAHGYTIRWIDDWNLYHVGEGEVHCGTNTHRKIPDAKWWESGR